MRTKIDSGKLNKEIFAKVQL